MLAILGAMRYHTTASAAKQSRQRGGATITQEEMQTLLENLTRIEGACEQLKDLLPTTLSLMLKAFNRAEEQGCNRMASRDLSSFEWELSTLKNAVNDIVYSPSFAEKFLKVNFDFKNEKP